MLRFKRKAHLLVLDDDPSMQRLVATLLRREGHRVDVVSDAGQAIERIGRYDYAALLLDIMTPTEGGLTVLRHLRSEKPELMKRVLLVTASPDSILKGVSGDVFGVVRKPFEPSDLTDAIRKVIAS